MKIRTGENVIKLAESIDASANPMFAVYTDGHPRENPNSYLMRVCQTAPANILTMPPEKQKLRGVPTIFAISHEFAFESKLLLWPAPDKDYEAVLEFNPPRRRL